MRVRENDGVEIFGLEARRLEVLRQTPGSGTERGAVRAASRIDKRQLVAGVEDQTVFLDDELVRRKEFAARQGV